MLATYKTKLIHNLSSLTIIQASNFILSLIVIPHVVRRIGADGFGVVSVAQVLMIYLSILTEYGFSQTATRQIAIDKNTAGTKRISSVFSAVLVSKLLIAVVCFGLMMILIVTIPFFNNHFTLYLFAFSFVLGQALIMNWFFSGMEKMQYIAFSSLFGRAIFVLLTFIFIKAKSDAPLFLFFLGLGNCIAGLITIYLAFKLYKLRFIMPGRKDIQQQLKNGWPITVTNLSITTCQYAAIFILRIFTNDFVVGYYSIAEKVFFAMKLMVNVFTQVAFPIVCQLLQKGKDHVLTFMRQVYGSFLLLVTVFTVLVFIFSPQIIFFLAGHNELHTAFLLRMFCFAVLVVCLNIPPYLILLAGDHKKSYLKIFTIGMVINLVGNVLLAYYFSATGTVIAVLITEIFITAGLYWEVYRRIFRTTQGAMTAGG